MATQRRLPLFPGNVLIGVERRLCLQLVSSDDAGYAYGLSPELNVFLAEQSKCARCQAPPVLLLEHIDCGQRQMGRRGVLLLISASEAETALRLIATNRRRGYLYAHSIRRDTSPGNHSSADTRTLLDLQNYRCYYCLQSLRKPEGTFKAHKDHCYPLSTGGSNNASSLVLACQECNLLKGSIDGVRFRRMRRRTLAPELQRELARLQRAVGKREA
jgi:5-methylcytosine-specific restriction endonuclease McrA